MKGIVSQAKSAGKRPYWISPTLWTRMWKHWETPEAQQRSTTASQSRNSDRDGRGVHKHVAGQKSFLTIQQEMEEELGRPVSLGEVFLRTHTNKDGTFVDHKAREVAEAYEKHLGEVMSEDDPNGPTNSENDSQHSTQRTLTIEEKNQIFLKCTQSDAKGNTFGLGQLADQIKKGKRKESYASSSAMSYEEMHEELQSAKRKIAAQEADNVRRDADQEKAQARISEMEKFMTFMQQTDPRISAYMRQQSALETSPADSPVLAPLVIPASSTPDQPAPDQPALDHLAL